ncbi:MAG TPA: UDP-N-acetylmuramoyl-L-alanine--D-glutamate ligase [Anaerolineales bacterium]|nr:UDP-N-acetylmuramoyl-L-alanine--D-glutamate ligase [Anaerolineales bacterium]
MDWQTQRVVVIGAARQGTALSRYLAQQGAQVVLTDARTADQLDNVIQELSGLPIEWALGGHPLNLLDGAALVCPSGGVPLSIPLVEEARRRGIPLSNDSQVFLDAAPCRVVGITGSAGKTTTTTLVGRMAEETAAMKLTGDAYVHKAFVGGNIGSPLIAQVDEMQAEDIAVVELSSFQLELMTTSPQVAGLLNLTPNHLDRHGDMASYSSAKSHIFAHQSENDLTVLGYENEAAWAFAPDVPGRLAAFGRQLPEGVSGSFVRDGFIWLRMNGAEQKIMPLSDIQLRGEHNLLNVLAACALAAAADFPPEAMQAAVGGFNGVEHRLEFVGQWGGANWYNDSKATSPAMSVTAIRAFTEPLVVLAGGRDKHLPWEAFAAAAQERVDHLILFGEAAPVIEAALDKEKNYTLEVCGTLEQAVEAAARCAAPGDVVLLAPGGTSFDAFSDYEARGRRFKQQFQKLPQKENER